MKTIQSDILIKSYNEDLVVNTADKRVTDCKNMQKHGDPINIGAPSMLVARANLS